jgi:hypothetical protein
MTNTSFVNATFSAIDAVNQQDPNTEPTAEGIIAKEHLYAQRMTKKLNEFIQNPSEHLQIACRAQHIKRWSIARKDYPMDRTGYKKWRVDLGAFHANLTAELMAGVGYDEDDQERVKNILQKRHLKRDSEVQSMEDVACLVFMQYHLANFAQKHEEPKLIGIIQKTWNKMSEQGQQAALSLPLSDKMLALVQKALS